MKLFITYILFFIGSISSVFAQTLAEAKELYLNGDYIHALPIFEAEHAAKPTDANINQWYGASLFETGGDLKKAEECLLIASKKNIPESFFYLGQIYTQKYRFTEASEAFDKYESLLKKTPQRTKEQKAKYEANAERLAERMKQLSRLRRMVSNTEDIQIIDSLVVDKADFLSAYKLSKSSGHLKYFNQVFSTNKDVKSTVYFNEKETKIYYAQPNKVGVYTLFSKEKLLDEFGNEKQLSATNFNLTGDLNFPYMMADGVTIYFAAKDVESLGGYDLFVSRYNLNNDTYLSPERLNMPFNSIYNDYMMVIDEEKGVGWFASDRFQPEEKVCIYTFIPNKVVKIIQSDDEVYMADRANIASIKQSWVTGQDYSQLISLAKKAPKEEVKQIRDFTFVIDDNRTYYMLSDFQNKAAGDMFYKVMGLKNEEKSLSDRLDHLRTEYSKSSADAKRSMTAEILELERKLERLQNEIPSLEIQARNMEIQSRH